MNIIAIALITFTGLGTWLGNLAEDIFSAYSAFIHAFSHSLNHSFVHSFFLDFSNVFRECMERSNYPSGSKIISYDPGVRSEHSENNNNIICALVLCPFGPCRFLFLLSVITGPQTCIFLCVCVYILRWVKVPLAVSHLVKHSLKMEAIL